jgi:serine/threonine protein kinase
MSNPVGHPSLDHLRRYHDGELSPAEFEEVEQHEPEKCSWCQAFLRVFRLADGDPALLLGGMQPVPPDLPGYRYEREPGGQPRELGKGGMGVVYLARREDDGCSVAVKFLRAGIDLDRLQRRRFLREAAAALELDHPAIVRGRDFGAVADRMYYVMEYLPGCNLREFQKGGSLLGPPGRPGRDREVARWLRVLADGLRSAHDRELTHRDLKPDNILVEQDAQGNPVSMKIADFGLVRWRHPSPDGTELDQVPGTPEYMAPEQLDPDRPLTPAVDIYGLGGILYFMLTGRPPLDRTCYPAVRDLLSAIQERDPLPPRRLDPEISLDLETICLKCLRKNPGDRYENLAELIEDLDLFLAGGRLRARRQTRLDRALRYVRHHRKTVVVVTTILLLLVASLCLLVVSLGLWRHASRQTRAARSAAGQQLIQGARFTLSRGLLREAETLYDQAIEFVDPEDRPPLEVERLRCLFAFGRWEQLRSELDRLSALPSLPPRYRAQVLLHQGDLALWDPTAEAQSRGVAWLNEALGTPDGLGEADAAYARGVLEASTSRAQEHFRKAVQAENGRFHLRAHAALLVELVLSGQYEQAREEARFFETAFPSEPVAPLARLVMATLEEDKAGRNRHRDQLARLIANPERMTRLDGLLRIFDQAIETNHNLHGPRGMVTQLWKDLQGRSWDEVFRPAASLRRFLQSRDLRLLDDLPPVGIGLPLLRRPVLLLEQLAAGQRALEKKNYRQAADLLAEAAETSPESLIRLMQANAHLWLSIRRLAEGDRPGAFRESLRAHELAEQAARAPTLIPFGPHRHTAHWLCLMIEVGWYAEGRFLQTAAGAGLAAHGAGGSPLGTLALAALAQHLDGSVPRRKDRRHLEAVVTGSRGYDEARHEVFPALMLLFPPEDARAILADWVEDLPEEPAPLRSRARLELELDNPAESLRWAERGLRLAPWDLELRGLRDQARKRLEGLSRTPH